MSWQRHLGWVVALMLVGCTFGPAATTVPTLATPAGAESTADALRMAVEENDLKVDPEQFRRMVNWCVYSQFADHFHQIITFDRPKYD